MVCNKCKHNSDIVIKSTPIEVIFTLGISKQGKLKRNTDFSAQQRYDPDKYAEYPYEAICSFCNSEVDLNTLEISKSCMLCNSTEVQFCKYNEMYFCPKCAKKYLNYCKTCPLLVECQLGSENVNI